ncbi:hypothetical protein DFH27DRAFT_609712 [Peziza echinospora]|nr:hypothetical protein DFH27DRAFT_609712 [Peziza echinospora]
MPAPSSSFPKHVTTFPLRPRRSIITIQITNTNLTLKREISEYTAPPGSYGILSTIEPPLLPIMSSSQNDFDILVMERGRGNLNFSLPSFSMLRPSGREEDGAPIPAESVRTWQSIVAADGSNAFAGAMLCLLRVAVMNKYTHLYQDGIDILLDEIRRTWTYSADDTQRRYEAVLKTRRSLQRCERTRAENLEAYRVFCSRIAASEMGRVLGSSEYAVDCHLRGLINASYGVEMVDGMPEDGEADGMFV